MKRPIGDSARIAIAVSTAWYRLRLFVIGAAAFPRITRERFGLFATGERYVCRQPLDHHGRRDSQAKRHPYTSDFVTGCSGSGDYGTDSQPCQHSGNIRAEALRNRTAPRPGGLAGQPVQVPQLDAEPSG